VTTPVDYYAIVDWPRVRPNLYGWGGPYGVDVEGRASDEEDAEGDGGDYEGIDLDDLDRVHSVGTKCV